MLNQLFPATMATGGSLKIVKNQYFPLFFAIKTDFKVLYLFDGGEEAPKK
jgi:hypothetical protein